MQPSYMRCELNGQESWTESTIGKYASKHGNTATVKKADFRGWRLGESTIHLFNKCYIEVLKKAKNIVEPLCLKWKYCIEEMKVSTNSWWRGHQSAGIHPGLEKDGTPVNVNTVLAAAAGVVTAVDRTLLKKNGGSLNYNIHGHNYWCSEWSLWSAEVLPRLRVSYLMQTSLNSWSPTCCRSRKWWTPT